MKNGTNLFEILNKYSDNVAVIDDIGIEHSYHDLQTKSFLLSNKLKCESKCLILIVALNNIETMIGYLATLGSSHAGIIVDGLLDSRRIEDICKKYNPDYIWEPAKNKSNGLYYFGGYGLFKLNRAGYSPIPHENLSIMLSSSGSTGSPKFIRLSNKNLISNAKSIGAYLDLNETERPITNLPFSYSYGLSVINSHLSVGATILLTNHSIVKSAFWNFFKSQKATSMAGVPYTYQILKRIGFYKMDLPSLRYMTQAGGKLTGQMVKDINRWLTQKNIRFYVMYGQTEATARIAYLPCDKVDYKCSSIGIAIPYGKISLVDENQSEIKEFYQKGELIYRGANVMMGYAMNRMDIQRGDDLDGVLNTGDLAYFDEDGYYYIVGRKNRFLKLLGNRINLDEVEMYLKDADMDCICGGSDEKLVIVTTQKDSKEKIVSTVIKRFRVKRQLLEIKCVNELRRLQNGKVNYQEIANKISDTIATQGLSDVEQATVGFGI